MTKTAIDTASAAFAANRAAHLAKLADLEHQLTVPVAGGGERYVQRHHERGKLTPRERIELLIDEDTPFLELCALAGWGTDYTAGGSIVGGIGVVEGTEVLIIASDPTVKGGAINTWSLRKSYRLSQIAEENGLITINLVESAGADLPSQKDIFVPGGRIFRNITRASQRKQPTIALVFGNSTAGGAYIPGMSDYTVMVKEKAKVFLAGPPLVKMATGEVSDDETLGGAEMHARVSGLADYLAVDEHDAIRIGRQIVRRLNWHKKGPAPKVDYAEPLFDAEELLGILPSDLKVPFDPREIVARLVDGSEFDEFKPLYGTSLVTGWAQVHGYPVGILANAQGILFSEEAQKAAQFIQLANQVNTPLLFLHNTTGYMVGAEYEQGGIIKHGAQMINAVSNSTVPHISIVLGASYGAGAYGMSGRSYDPRFLFSWAGSKTAVMGAEQLSGVMEIVMRESAEAKGQPVDEDGIAGMKAFIVAEAEKQSLDYFISGMVYDDGVIDPRDTRSILGICLSTIHTNPVQGAEGFGVFGFEDIVMITSILVANRGEIARRVFRTARDLGIETVAVHSDADAHAPFVAEADRAVHLPGNAPAETYLRGDLVIAAAKSAGADAIHPGYGFLSENADFARQVAEAGLTWIGPNPDTIVSMGSKIEAKKLMKAAGVPILEVDPSNASADDFPLLVKASAGGGGRGMRVVERAEDLQSELDKASAEAASAFGDGTVFVEPYLSTARHVEVQVLADTHGTVWILGDRDCSIQRRHQKVVEEAPAPGLSEGTRKVLHDAARAAAQAVDYVGAGTVEFLVDEQRVFFLEMNTRLQVEHPVTEEIFGVDLVALQIAVAEGSELGEEPAHINGHAVEVRLYAEDPSSDYAPQTGVLREFDIPLGAGVRVDSAVETGSEVGIHYDAMIAKVIAHGADRTAAIRALDGALRRARIHGLITNRDLLRAILADEEFAAGRVHTALLGERIAEWTGTPADPAAAVVAAAVASAIDAAQSSRVLGRIPTGYRNLASQPRIRTFTLEGREDELTVSYATKRGVFIVDGYSVVDAGSRNVTLETTDGVRSAYRIALSRDRVDVDGPEGSFSFVPVPRFVDPSDQVAQGSLLAPMPAAVTQVAVELGQTVSKGDVIVVVEAMKMQHTITAPSDGVVAELNVSLGAQVESGAVLAVISTTEEIQENAS